MWKWFGALSRVDTGISLGAHVFNAVGALAGTGLMSYLTSHVDVVMAHGWAAVVIVGIVLTCVVATVASLSAIAWRYFRPLPTPNSVGSRQLDASHEAPVIGEFGRVTFQRIVRIPPWPADATDARKYISLSLRFTFGVPVANPSIRITVTRRRNMPFELDPHRVDERAWYAPIEARTWHERDAADITLAIIGDGIDTPGFSGDWASPPGVIQNNQYMFLIEIISTAASQSLRIYLNVPSQFNTDVLFGHDTYNGNIFYLQDERFSPFDDGRFELSSNDAPTTSVRLGWGAGPHGSTPHGG